MSLLPEQDHYGRILRFENSQTRRLGQHRLGRYLRNRRYYYGENEDPEDVRQPLSINYPRKISDKHTAFLFGEWERDIVDFVVSPLLKPDDEDEKKLARAIQNAFYLKLRQIDGNARFLMGAYDGSIYGDTIFKTRYDIASQKSTLDTVLPEYYHAMWDALDVSKTNEALIASPVDRLSAFQRYGTSGNSRYFEPHSLLDPSLATVWEHWTPWQRTIVVDDQVVSANVNPYAQISNDPAKIRPGFLPFVHIPNQSVNGEYWGFGDAEPIFDLADELNLRLADMGDIINYHAHPITLLRKFFGEIDQLPLTPDGVWNMGREGEAEYLEWSGPSPQIFEYLSLLVTMMLDTTGLTATAFGRPEQSQASGNALAINMIPVTEVVRRKRAVWGPRLRDTQIQLFTIEERVMNMTKPGSFQAMYGFTVRDIARMDVMVKWAPILPRDRQAVVQEYTTRIINSAVSLITALREMGSEDPEGEKERIFNDLRDLNALATAQLEETAAINAEYTAHAQATVEAAKPVPPGGRAGRTPRPPRLLNRTGGKNSDRGNGGRNTNDNTGAG